MASESLQDRYHKRLRRLVEKDTLKEVIVEEAQLNLVPETPAATAYWNFADDLRYGFPGTPTRFVSNPTYKLSDISRLIEAEKDFSEELKIALFSILALRYEEVPLRDPSLSGNTLWRAMPFLIAPPPF